jgi:hypothetical protein
VSESARCSSVRHLERAPLVGIAEYSTASALSKHAVVPNSAVACSATCNKGVTAYIVTTIQASVDVYTVDCIGSCVSSPVLLLLCDAQLF